MQLESEDDFRDWLKTQDQEVCVAIATRAALRVWPFIFGNEFWKSDEVANVTQGKLALLTGWAMMTSGVAAFAPTPDVKTAAAAAARAATSAGTTSVAAVSAAAVSVHDAVFVAAARSTLGSNDAATKFAARGSVYAPSANEYAARGSVYVDAAIRAAAYRDADFSAQDMLYQLLWHENDPPEGLRPEDIGETILDTNPHFEFLKRWYDGMVAGQPLPTDLLTRIVTQIDRTTWESGAEPVAKAIARIEAKWLAEQAAKDVETYLSNPRPQNDAAVNPMIGHNHPPPDALMPLDEATLVRLLQTTRTIQEQMQSAQPDGQIIKVAAENVEAVRQTLGNWFAAKLNIAADEFFKEFGKWSGRLIAGGCGATALWLLGLLEKLQPLAQSLWTALRAAGG